MDRYEEAMNRMLQWEKEHTDGYDIDAMKSFVFPELDESEDERIRKEIIDWMKGGNTYDWQENKEKWISYLEKQKDANKAIEAVERIDKYIDEHTANAHDMKDSNPDKKYYSGVDDTLSNIAGILISAYSEEKQKEQKPTQKPINWTELTWQDIVELECIINNVHYDFSAGIGQESFGKEVLDRFRSTKGDEYLDEAEQKYWREEGQKEQQPAEWSEEDDALLKEIVSFFKDGTVKLQHDLDLYAGFLEKKFKSLRPQPHWKPSEEQMKALYDIIPKSGQPCTLQSLHHELQQL